MADERFEVVLKAEEARRVHDDMRVLDRVAKAAHVRDCLLAGRAGRAEELSCALGSLALGVNELVEVIRAFSLQPGSLKLAAKAARLIVLLIRMVKQVQISLHQEEL